MVFLLVILFKPLHNLPDGSTYKRKRGKYNNISPKTLPGQQMLKAKNSEETNDDKNEPKP